VQGYIRDNDLPTISAGNASAIESDDLLIFTVTLSVARAEEVSVHYATGSQSATSNVDFVGTAGLLVFAPGQIVKTIAVPITNDRHVESDETLSLTLSNADGAVVVGDTYVGTIVDNDQVFITLNSLSVEESAGQATFTVSISTPSDEPITVDYTTQDGSAVAGSDYTAHSGTITIPAGQTTGEITVAILNDAEEEDGETFSLVLSNAHGGSIVDEHGVAASSFAAVSVILASDAPPVVSIGDAAVNENAGNAVFTIQLSTSSDSPVWVDFVPVSGAAIAGLDFVPYSRTTVVDATGQSDEATLVNQPALGQPGVLGPQTAAVAFNGVNQYLSLPAEAFGEYGSSTGYEVSFEVWFLAPQGASGVILGQTDAGSVPGGSAPAEGSVPAVALGTDGKLRSSLFWHGDTTNRIVSGGETRYDDGLWHHVAATYGSGVETLYIDGVEVGQQTVDNVSYSSSYRYLLATGYSDGWDGGNGGWHFFRGVLDEAAIFQRALGATEVAADYAGGVALESEGLSALYHLDEGAGSVLFEPGETSKTISIPIINDLAEEPDETFTVRLLNPVHAILGTSRGTGTIRASDPLPVIQIQDAIVDETAGNILFLVTLSVPSERTITAVYGTANDSALAGSDYTASSGTLTFSPGQTVATITVPITNDALEEAAETFFARLTSSTYSILGDGEAVGMIRASDPPPSIAIDRKTASEAAGQMVFTVSLSHASESTVTVSYTTVNSAAHFGSDFTAVAGSLAFAPGETSRTIAVPIINDLVEEVDETFFVDLSAAANAVIDVSRGIGTIEDNDAPTVSISDASVTEGGGLSFVVSLTNPSSQSVTMQYATASGTATSGVDYVNVISTTLTFGPGETSKTISIASVADTNYEANETFFCGPVESQKREPRDFCSIASDGDDFE